MRKSTISFAVCVAATSMMMSAGSLSAAPASGSAVRIIGDFPNGLIERVQYRSRRFVNERARDAYLDRRWSRMEVEVESDGTILLPGIETDRHGRTMLRGAPRSREGHPKRIGVWSGGSGGRLTGNVPQVHHRKH